MRDLAARLTAHTEGLLFAVILLLGAAHGVEPYFLTLSNAVDLIDYSVTTVLALGVFVAGGRRDRHLVRGHGLGGAVCDGVRRHRVGLPAPLCVALGLLVGLALGCLNAALIFYLRVTSIIITIATMSAYFALADVADRRQVDLCPARLVVDARRLWQTEAANGDLVRITLPILVAALGRTRDLAPDDPLGRRPPAHRDGRQPRGRAPPGRRHRVPCISWPTAISACSPGSPACCRRTGSARPCPTPWSATSSTFWPRPSSAAPV